MTSLIAQSDEKHAEARVEPDQMRSEALRAEADYIAEQSKEIRDAVHYDGPRIVK